MKHPLFWVRVDIEENRIRVVDPEAPSRPADARWTALQNTSQIVATNSGQKVKKTGISFSVGVYALLFWRQF